MVIKEKCNFNVIIVNICGKSKVFRDYIIDILKYLEENEEIVIRNGRLGVPYQDLKDVFMKETEIDLLYNLEYMIKCRLIEGNIESESKFENYDKRYIVNNDEKFFITFTGHDYIYQYEKNTPI